MYEDRMYVCFQSKLSKQTFIQISLIGAVGIIINYSAWFGCAINVPLFC